MFVTYSNGVSRHTYVAETEAEARQAFRFFSNAFLFVSLYLDNVLVEKGGKR